MTTIKEFDDWLDEHRSKYQPIPDWFHRDEVKRLIEAIKITFPDLSDEIIDTLETDLYDYEHNGNLLCDYDHPEFNWRIGGEGDWGMILTWEDYIKEWNQDDDDE